MNRIPASWRIISCAAAVAAAGAVYLFLFLRHVPYCMDEFGPYHLIACHYYPFSWWNIFREPCRCHDLAFFGGRYLPIRSCPYVGGSLHSLLYYPLFVLWRSPSSARLLDLIFLFLQALLLHRIFRVNLLLSFLFLLLCMPYAFQHMVDTGPIITHTISVFLVYYLVRRWNILLRRGSGAAWIFPPLIGLVLFLGIYAKLAFFFILPGILILVAYGLVWDETARGPLPRGGRARLGGQVLLLFAALCAPGAVLLSARDQDNVRYYKIMTSANAVAGPRELLSHARQMSRQVVDPYESAQRVLAGPGKWVTPGGLLWVGTIAAFLVYGLRRFRARGEGYGFVVLNFLLFLLSFTLIARTGEEVLMHHLVLCYPFIILAVFHLYSRLRADAFVKCLVVAFFAVNCGLYWRVTTFPSLRYSSMSNMRTMRLINEGFPRGYVIVVMDWGLYFMQSLYGDKEQCVVWIEKWNNRGSVERLKGVLRATDRRALFVGLGDSRRKWDVVAANFPGLVPLESDVDTGEWRVLYQP